MQFPLGINPPTSNDTLRRCAPEAWKRWVDGVHRAQRNKDYAAAISATDIGERVGFVILKNGVDPNGRL